eukprot:4881225-Pleurochrysis_carterae.AAC.7
MSEVGKELISGSKSCDRYPLLGRGLLIVGLTRAPFREDWVRCRGLRAIGAHPLSSTLGCPHVRILGVAG